MSNTASLGKWIDAKIKASFWQSINPENQISISVIFTSVNRTLKALARARELARPVGADIRIVAVQIVPYPLPLDRPPVPFEFVVRRFEEMTNHHMPKTPVSAYLCRDPVEALKQVLDPKSLVLIGFRKRWWPTGDERLARKLRRAGYEVLLVETE